MVSSKSTAFNEACAQGVTFTRAVASKVGGSLESMAIDAVFEPLQPPLVHDTSNAPCPITLAFACSVAFASASRPASTGTFTIR